MLLHILKMSNMIKTLNRCRDSDKSHRNNLGAAFRQGQRMMACNNSIPHTSVITKRGYNERLNLILCSHGLQKGKIFQREMIHLLHQIHNHLELEECTFQLLQLF